MQGSKNQGYFISSTLFPEFLVTPAQCDLKPDTCGQCTRANVTCSGYRNTEQIRFQNESQTVALRVMKLKTSEPRYLPLPIETQARDAFFTHYISTSCWEFLEPYYHLLDTPNALTLAIEAASLAFLWHQVYSEAALLASRQRYALALKMTNNMLQSRNEAVKDTTLITTLTFDVYEKITATQESRGRTSHIDGALALVKLRGLEHFKEPNQVKILERLEHSCVATSLTNGLQASDTVASIREHLGRLAMEPGSMATLESTATKIVNHYSRLRSDYRNGSISKEEFIRISAALDDGLQTCEEELPPSAKPTTIVLEHKSERAFHLYYHSYAHRRVLNSRNLLRVARIDLNESLVDHYSLLTDVESPTKATAAYKRIMQLVHEILASVPKYTDCNGPAREKLPTSTEAVPLSKAKILKQEHPHYPRHQADCYLLIFPLYAAGRSGAIPDVKAWVIEQLRYMASHFYLRKAEVVARILEGDEDICPWDVNVMLGSYALNIVG